MPPQDFSQKMVLALRQDLTSWPLTNTIGHLAAYLGNKMPTAFDTGAPFESQDGRPYPRNSQYAVVALQASTDDLRQLVATLQTSDLVWIAYTQDMIDHIDDHELAAAINKKTSDDLELLGVGIFGPKDELKKLTGQLKLWK